MTTLEPIPLDLNLDLNVPIRTEPLIKPLDDWESLAYNQSTYTPDYLPAKKLSIHGNNKNYLIKIDDDYKFVTDAFMDQTALQKIIKTYYPTAQLQMFLMSQYSHFLLTDLTDTNSFLKCNEFDPKEFSDKLFLFDDLVNYFQIFDTTNSFIRRLEMNNVKPQNKVSSLTKHVETESIIKQGVTTRNQIENSFGYNLASFDWTNTNNKSLETSQKCMGLMPEIPSNTMKFDANGQLKFNTDSISLVEPYSDDTINFMEIKLFNDSLLDTYQNYNIYFNSQFNNILIIDQKDDFIQSNNKFKKMFPELVFVLGTKLEDNKLKLVQELCKDIYVNAEDAKVKINRIIDDKVIDSKLSIDEIKGLIEKYFSLDNDPSHCIKFTNIWNIISSEIKVSESYINYIKRQLPIILTDMGLQKKRLADGIYWYGLVRKSDTTSQEKLPFVNPKISEKPITMEEFEKFRDNRSTEFYSYKPIPFIIDSLKSQNKMDNAFMVPSTYSNKELDDFMSQLGGDGLTGTFETKIDSIKNSKIQVGEDTEDESDNETNQSNQTNQPNQSNEQNKNSGIKSEIPTDVETKTKTNIKRKYTKKAQSTEPIQPIQKQDESNKQPEPTKQSEPTKQAKPKTKKQSKKDADPESPPTEEMNKLIKKKKPNKK